MNKIETPDTTTNLMELTKKLMKEVKPFESKEEYKKKALEVRRKNKITYDSVYHHTHPVESKKLDPKEIKIMNERAKVLRQLKEICKIYTNIKKDISKNKKELNQASVNLILWNLEDEIKLLSEFNKIHKKIMRD